MQVPLVKNQTVTANGSVIATRNADAPDVEGTALKFPTLHIHITSITGTSPSITFTFYDYDKAANDFVQVAPSTTAITATGDYTIVIKDTTNSISDKVKLDWVVAGTSPQVSFSATLRGQEDVAGGL